MGSIKWSVSNAVFVTEIDDEHKEIFEALSTLEEALANRGRLPDIPKHMKRLVASIDGHFAHEERLMRAARYGSLRWHKKSHDIARRRVGQFASRIKNGDTHAGRGLVQYLNAWLDHHTGLADRMMGAFLRNRQRSMGYVTLQAGTKPLDACTWVTASGDTLKPRPTRSTT